MNQWKRPQLKINEKYPLQTYPEDFTIEDTEYRGPVGKKHIFYFEFNGEKTCALVDDHWMYQKEDGTITHKGISSFSIELLTAETLNTIAKEEKSKLTEMLNSVGVKL